MKLQLKPRCYICLIIFTILFIKVDLFSQDIHYSQFYNSPLNINPALTGIFSEDKRFTVSFRDQHRSIPVPWMTFSGSYEFKLNPNKQEDGFIALGVLYNYDSQGDANINLNNLNIAFNYVKPIKTKHILSLAGQIGYATRAFNTDNLTWDKQWGVDQRFDPSLPSQENFNNLRIDFVDTGVGLNYRYQSSKRSYLHIGAGYYHFLQSSVNYIDNFEHNLPERLSLSVLMNFKFASIMDVQLHTLKQYQVSNEELIFGGLLKFYLNQNNYQDAQIHLGLNYRTTQFLAPVIAFQWNQYYLGASYDLDYSPFSDIKGVNGGIEIHFRYMVTGVKPLKRFKACPIF